MGSELTCPTCGDSGATGATRCPECGETDLSVEHDGERGEVEPSVGWARKILDGLSWFFGELIVYAVEYLVVGLGMILLFFLCSGW